MSSLLLLADGEVASSAIDFSTFITSLTSSVTPAQILAILASVVGVGMTFFLMWLGVRKIGNAFTTAVSTGKLHVK